VTPFCRRDATHMTGLCWEKCPSISVFVTFLYCIETAKAVISHPQRYRSLGTMQFD